MEKGPSLILRAPENNTVKGSIQLPASKSLSNRALIIDAITGFRCTLQNLSPANDTTVLNRALQSMNEAINIEDAGTAMRFSLAFFALSDIEKTITGTKRMKERPIGPLVDALRTLGCHIEYLEKEGYPPVQTKGVRFTRNSAIALPASVSSQFVSALILCAPLLPSEIELKLEGEIYSRPYIDMTLNLARHFGGQSGWINPNTLLLSTAPYAAKAYTVEPDWSSASYWLSIAALAEDSEIALQDLTEVSLQGDAQISDLIPEMAPLHYQEEEVGTALLAKTALPEGKLEPIDFRPIPDMAQTILPMLAGLGLEIEFTGVESLKIKETNRVQALQNELAKLNYSMEEFKPDWYLLKKEGELPQKASISTYKDHRMAMGFAPLALRMETLEIEQPTVVKKSYPPFWEDLQKVGFRINESKEGL